MSAQKDHIVAQAAESTSRVGDKQKAAQQLAETSAQLRRLVEPFTTDSVNPYTDGARETMAAPAAYTPTLHSRIAQEHPGKGRAVEVA
jgi:hypothetical protein